MTDLGSADDHAKRAYDIMNMHLIAKGDSSWGCWVALRLSDGGSDGTLYETRSEAIAHQLHETQCCYLVIPPTGFTLSEVREFLNLSRSLRERGARIPSHGDYRKAGFKL